MPRHAAVRLLDSFFRRPVLSLLPLVLLAALGVFSLANEEVEYRSQGSILVENETFLSSLTDLRDGNGGWETPSSLASRELGALLQTDAFVAAVAETAEIPHDRPDPDLYRDLRSSIGTTPAGDNLLQVWAVSENSDRAQRLARATIDSLVEWKIDVDVAQSTAAEEFISPLIEQYRDDLANAREALTDYLAAEPAPREGSRLATQEVTIQGLTSEVADATARYEDAIAKAEEARLATAQAERDVRAQLQLVDEPTVPNVPTSADGQLKAIALTMGLFLMVGGMLSLAVVVAGALLDQSVRHPWEVSRRLGLNVLAVVPDASRRRRLRGSTP